MKKSRGITLISLVITIVVLIILASVGIYLSLGNNGIFTRAKQSKEQYLKASAREKLEIALLDLQAQKYENEEYNEDEYINSYLESREMTVEKDIVIVDGWKFKIDRNIPKIIEDLGQANITVTKTVKEYLGKNENGKYIAEVTLIIESSEEIENIIFYELDGTAIKITPSEEKLKIAKDMTIQLDEEYKIIINTKDGKSEERIISEKLPTLGILISTPYVGTRSVTTKVQYVSKEEEIETYTYIINDEEIETTTELESKLEDYLEAETTYIVKVRARYKNNLTVESNEVKIKTKERTYLYNNGDQCTELTGGWKAESIGNEDETTIFIEPYIDTNKDGAIYAYIESLTNGYYGGSITINNKIDFSNYKKICFRMSATVGRYESSTVVQLFANSNNAKYIDTMCGVGNGELNNQIVRYNIDNIGKIEDIYIYLQAHPFFGGAYCTIYEAWLEK